MAVDFLPLAAKQREYETHKANSSRSASPQLNDMHAKEDVCHTHHSRQWVVAIAKNESVILAWHGKRGQMWHCPFLSAYSSVYTHINTHKKHTLEKRTKEMWTLIFQKKRMRWKKACAHRYLKWEKNDEDDYSEKKFCLQNDFTNKLMPMSFWSIYVYCISLRQWFEGHIVCAFLQISTCEFAQNKWAKWWMNFSHTAHTNKIVKVIQNEINKRHLTPTNFSF